MESFDNSEYLFTIFIDDKIVIPYIPQLIIIQIINERLLSNFTHKREDIDDHIKRISI